MADPTRTHEPPTFTHSKALQQRAAELQRALIDALPAHLALLDEAGNILAINAAWRRFADTQHFQIADYGIGCNYLETCERAAGPSAEGAAQAAKGIRRVLAGLVPQFSIEYPCHTPDARRWFRLLAAPLRTDEDSGAVVMHIDITDQKLAEELLRENEARFRLLAQVTNDVVWDWNIKTGHLWWSDGFRETFGIRSGELEFTIDSWSEPIHPADRERVLRKLDKALLSKDDCWSDEYRFKRKDGSYACICNRGLIIRDASGAAIRMVGGVTDLSARKQVEAQLEEQALLLDRAHDAILVNDWEGRIVFWNKSAERLHGWTAAEVIGKIADEFLYAQPEQVITAREALLERDDWAGELVKKTKDGRELIVRTSFTLIRDENGRPDRILAISTDVTENKKLEAQLLRAQRMESIGALAGGIAHDLNNILGPILMSLHLLKDRVNDAGARDLVDLLGSSAQRGADIVRQILAFARGAEGRKSVVHPKHLLQEMERFARETFLQQVRIVSRYSRDCSTVQGDPTQLHQVLLNLCVNARDAMQGGGVLTLTAENAMVDESYATMTADAKPGRYVMISVSDTGIGIPKELHEKIFDPFFTTKSAGNGTGLGLATVAAIVKAHGGFVHVDSEPGKGATIKVYLPAHTAEETEAPEKGDESHPQGNGELILIIDDEAAVRSIASRTLQKFGYQVITANDGADALAIYAQRQSEIAVVVTDMMMPVLDGVATIHTLRRINPDVKVIAVCGLATEAQFRAAASAGAVELLSKPYSADTILQSLKRILHPGS